MHGIKCIERKTCSFSIYCMLFVTKRVERKGGLFLDHIQVQMTFKKVDIDKADGGE